MKKISLIAGLAMLVTVGGVFAAWQYGSSLSDTDTKDISISIDNEVHDVTAGASVELNDDSVFSYSIAQTGADEATYSITAGGSNKDLVATYANNSGKDLTLKTTVDLTVTYGTDATYTTAEATETALKQYLNVNETAFETTVKHADVAVANGTSSTPVTILSSATIKTALDAWKLGTVSTGAKAREFIQVLNLTDFSITVTVTLA